MTVRRSFSTISDNSELVDGVAGDCHETHLGHRLYFLILRNCPPTSSTDQKRDNGGREESTDCRECISDTLSFADSKGSEYE
jgi:hypothetical protein